MLCPAWKEHTPMSAVWQLGLTILGIFLLLLIIIAITGKKE